MKISVTFIMVIGLFFSCSNNNKDEEYFVIKNPDTSKTKVILELPRFFYGHHNFIFTNSSQLFYHNNYVFYMCGTGLDLTKPPYLHLTPDSLIEIKEADLVDFLKDKLYINENDHLETAISISAPTDMSRNKALKIIVDYIKPHKGVMCNIRKWTEEEKYVTFCKITNRKYDPKKMNWKIGFDQEESFASDSIIFFSPLEN